jgi:hypothetical protein
MTELLFLYFICNLRFGPGIVVLKPMHAHYKWIANVTTGRPVRNLKDTSAD